MGTDPAEIQKTVMFYAEAIDDRMEDGMTEEEAVAAMGNIDDILREVRGTWSQEPPRGEASYAGGQARPGPVKQTFDPAYVTRVEIYDTSGSVHILPSPDGLIHLEYDATEAWRYEITGGNVVTVRRARNSPTENMDFNVFGYKFSIPKPDLGGIFATELQLTVRVPEGDLAVSVNTASGGVSCQGVRLGTLTAILASGDAELTHVTAGTKLSLSTASGDVELEDVHSPELSVNTVSGDIEGELVYCGGVNLRTVSGDMELRELEAAQRAAAVSVSGDTWMGFSYPTPNVSADSVSGHVTLKLAGEGQYSVNVKTNSGKVDLPRWPQGGPNLLRVKTMSGNIGIEYTK